MTYSILLIILGASLAGNAYLVLALNDARREERDEKEGYVADGADDEMPSLHEKWAAAGHPNP